MSALADQLFERWGKLTGGTFGNFQERGAFLLAQVCRPWLDDSIEATFQWVESTATDEENFRNGFMHCFVKSFRQTDVTPDSRVDMVFWHLLNGSHSLDDAAASVWRNRRRAALAATPPSQEKPR